MNTLVINNMKYINIIFMTIVALITTAACLSGMSVLYNHVLMTNIPWYTMISVVIGNCFLGYFGILIIWLYINYIWLSFKEKN
jgi:hypothetical protein